jgi:hypothetical protein
MNRLDTIFFFDLKRRAAILMEELAHLSELLEFHDLKSKGLIGGSSVAHFKRIIEAAKLLYVEHNKDIEEIDSCFNWYSKRRVDSLAPYFRLCWHQKMLEKFAETTKQIGKLHDRIDRQLRRTNYDGTSLILRRRSEEGQVDKYLNEHVKWIYRDIALLAQSMGAKYPYDEVPATFQFSSYDRTASNTEFASSVNQATPGAKFATVGISYLMSECIVLQPIIGHELAHRVLEDIFGCVPGDIRLTDANCSLGIVYQTLDSLITSFTASFKGLFDIADLEVDYALGFESAREILCDVLATARFGSAYLYGWLLEICSGDVYFSGKFSDLSGKTTRNTFSDTDPSEEWIQRNIVGDSFKPNVTGLPMTYLRGIVITSLLSRMQQSLDDATNDLIKEVDNFLEKYLRLSCGCTNPDALPNSSEQKHYEFVKSAGQLLAATISGNTKSNRVSFAVLDAETQSSCGEFFNSVNKFWMLDKNGIPTNFCLQRQVMSGVIRNKYAELLGVSLNHKAEAQAGILHTINDCVWKAEWKLAWASEPRDLNEKTNTLRSVNFLAIDDYLYRTGNPHRLLDRLAADKYNTDLENILNKNFHNTFLSGSNSINVEKLEAMYAPNWLAAFDQVQKDVKPDAKFVSIEIAGTNCGISTESLSHIAPLILDEKKWGEIIDNASQSLLFLCNSNPPINPACAADAVRQSVAPSQPTSTTEGSHKYKSTSFDNVETLGRYDYAVMATMAGSTDTSSFAPGFLKSILSNNSRQHVHVARKKKLFPISTGANNFKLQPCAIILVSLVWDASRLHLASRIADYCADQLELKQETFAVFTSDGWEDIICMVSSNEFEKEITTLIKWLNENLFVQATETLFSSSILSKSDAKKVLRVRFLCGGGDSFSLLRSEIKLLLAVNPNWCFELSDLAGARNFEIFSLSPETSSDFLLDVYRSLHTVAHSHMARIETRVSWSDHIAEGVSCSN